MEFKINFIDGVGEFFIPADVVLSLPKDLSLDKKDWHFLTYIPWDEKYFASVPEDFLDFFKFVLPYLRARTTDVHTAISLGFLDELISKFPEENINRRVVVLALILHDSGWSKLSDQEVANSLGVKGLKLNEIAMGPKEKHAVEGVKIAKKLLGEGESDGDEEGQFKFEPKLSNEEKELIFKAIRFHDRPEEVAGASEEMPIEVKLLVDLDHLWSFTHENFWQDTVRKGVAPKDYLENLANDLDGYFVTEPGKGLARKLLGQRKKEVEFSLSQTTKYTKLLDKYQGFLKVPQHLRGKNLDEAISEAKEKRFSS